MSRLLRTLTLLAALGLCARAEEVQIELRLKNGDRLTGILLEQAGGKLYLRSPVYGTIGIPESQIIGRRELKEIMVDTATLAALEAAPDEVEHLHAKDPKEELASLPQWKKVIKGMTGGVEFGYRDEFGRTQAKSTSLIAEAEYTTGPNNYKLSTKYYYSEYDSNTQSDRTDTYFRYRHDLNPITFVQSNTSYTVDAVKEINVNFEQSVGLGWGAVKNERHKLNLGLAALAQYREIYQIDQGTTGFVDFFQDYAFRINDRISFQQDASVKYSPIDRAQYTIVNGKPVPANDTAQNYQLLFNATLQGKLTHRITLNLRYEYEYDNTIIDPELRSDKRISTTIGYAF